MRKLTRLCLCAAAVTLLAAGCGKKEAEETTEAATTAQAEEIPQATVTLGEYKGIAVTDPYEEVTDEEVEERIQMVLDANPILEEVDREAALGDTVNIDYVGMKDGVPFDRGADDAYDLELGSGSFIDGFEDGLVGAKKGDELSLNLTFPENYGNEELAGQDVVFDVTVNAVKEKKDAVLDDAFVQKVSQESKTVEEYRKEMRSSMEDMARQTADAQIQNDIMEKILENAEFTGLEAQVDAEFAAQWDEMETALSQQGMTVDQYAQMYQMDEEALKSAMMSEVENVLKLNLVADAVAEKENLAADDASRERLAEANGAENVLDLVSQYGQEAVDQAAKRINVMNFLVDNANVE